MPAVLAALLRLEQQRQPLTDRATLPPLLAQVAAEIHGLTGAARVTLDVAADAFEPPLEIQVEVGVAPADAVAPASRQALLWGGVHLATVEIVPFDQAASEQVALRGQNVAGDLGMALERLLGQVAQALPDLRIEQQIVLPVMPRRVAACVFGMVRNGLSNVLQHAQAHTVSVHIGPAQGGVLVRVRDDGVGVRPREALAAPGIGLESILERAQALGGRSILDGAPGHGVSLEIWLPLPDEEEPYG